LSYDQTLPNRSLSHLELFSLRDNKWNQIEDPHFTYFNAAAVVKVGLFFNGAFHWVAGRNDLSVDVSVVFDLMERKLLEMPLPDDFDNDPVSYGLWVFGEFLSLWGMDFRNSRVEIWVMKEYKLHSSWTKTLLIPIDYNIFCFSPIYSTKSGDIIGTSFLCGLVKYNDKGQLLEYQEGRGNVRQVAMYTESLLSPHVDLEQVYEDDTNKKNQVLKYSHSPFS
jgi:F-box interacting protein